MVVRFSGAARKIAGVETGMSALRALWTMGFALALLCGFRITAHADDQPVPAAQAAADEDQPADADAAVQRQPAQPLPGFNPLQILQRVFNPPRPAGLRGRPRGGRAGRANPKAEKEGEAQPARSNPSDRDYIDARAPHDAKIEHQLRLAQAAIKKNDWKQAVTLLQHLLDLPEDSLHRLPDGKWQSVRVMAARELGRAPQSVLESYRQQNGGLAKQLLADALRDGDVSGVIRVATRFFHTDAGYQAADALARIHQDRAEFGIASQWLDELQQSKASFVQTPAWRVKAAAVYQLAGREKDAERLLPESGSAQIGSKSWIEALPRSSHGASPLSEWLQLQGNSARTGVQIGGAPFLMAEWHVPYSASHSVRQRLEWMIQELGDQNRPTSLAAQPLATRGKAIYRDLRGVRVIDLETGAPVWESIEGMSAERIATGMINENDGDQPQSIHVFNEMHDPFGGQQADSHPLMNLMLRDAAYNTLSSDGRQVFVLEDQGIMSRHHPGYHWGWDGEQADQYGFSWSTNRLSSYDLETGRPLWMVGGPETSESFQLPLAGVYFHGVPTPEGDDLFVIGAKGDELRLWCLDRRTGGFRWSQLIGYADAKIDQDLVRRWMAALPSVSEGIVVCPTTLGWLVAVDRLRQTVLWAVRYSPANQGMDVSMGRNVAPMRELGGQWGGGAPTIVGQHVLYTPPEDNLLICVDLVSGTLRWQAQREDGQYLAGIADDQAFVVGLRSVIAYSIADGKKLWTHDIGDDALPSGRAALTSTQLFLPLNSGELRVIDIADGKTALRTFVPAGEPPLGNLLLHEGRMASLSPRGLTGFRQQDALREEIRRRKGANPHDPIALLNEAEIYLLNREAEQAIVLLKQAAQQPLPDDLQERWHRDRIAGLTAVIRKNLAGSADALAELETAAKTPEERLLHLDFSAERFLAAGHHEQAFDLYWKLTNEPAEGFVTRTDDAKVLTQRMTWLGGRLRDVWSAATGPAREQIDARIADIIAKISPDNEPSARVTDLLAFHPGAQPLIRQRLEAQAQAKDAGRAEIDLLRLTEANDSSSAAWATWQLAEFLHRHHLSADAAWHLRRLETEFGAATLPDGRTGAQVAEAVRQSLQLPADLPPLEPTWDERPLKVTQLPYVYNQPPQEIPADSRLPFFDAVGIEFLPREQRLSFEPRDANGFRWLAPLRNGTSNRHNGYLSAQTLGHCVAIVHQDVLQVLNPLTKELLWSVSLNGLADGGLPPSYTGRQPTAPMWAASQGSGLHSPIFQQQTGDDRLAAVQPGYVAVHGRRALHVLDARTGTEIWRRTNVPPHSRVAAGPDVLWLLTPNRQQAQGYRVADGTPVPVEQFDKVLEKAFGIVGNDFLLAESGAALKIPQLNIPLLTGGRTTLRRHNPVSGTDVWREEFKSGAFLARLSAEELFVVPSSGEAELVDTATGKRRPLEALTSKDLGSRQESYALADEGRVYLLVNSEPNAGFHHFAESLPSVRAHGTLFAWERATGKLLWKQSLKNQHLIVDRLRIAPVLVFCSREWKQRGNVNFSQLNLLVLHKQSGKPLHESTTPTMYNGFHSLAILPAEQAVELRSYNQRVKLSPADKPAEAKGSD